ncbi:MAG TPA: complex I NDUFA9 subunit family protein [Dissulfurispiraceae bacterium]|nr:complex I NDUFA9 subunit family protein [Dissulfurispiraceae bacterium]
MMFFIAGCTGFIGRHLVSALAAGGMQAVCLARSAAKSEICKKAGFDVVIGDITDRESLKGKLDNCDTVVHLVGIIEEKEGLSFDLVHVNGTENLVNEAKKAKVKHFFYQSALGASPSSWSRYLKTKAEAEEIVRTSGIPYAIFRPSLVVGDGDGFTSKLKDLIASSPVVPVPGDGKAKFQPIYVGDLVKCFIKLFSSASTVVRAASPVYELGGPEHLTYNELLSLLMEATGVRKPIVHVPMEMVKLGLPLSGIFQGIAGMFGKTIPSVTLDQLRLLETDNICETDAVEKHFGFVPVRYEEALRLFIKRQYTVRSEG